MNLYKSYILIIALFFSFFSDAMQLINFDGNIFLNILWYIQPSDDETLSDKHNTLKYFYKNIMLFSFINKRMNAIAKEFLEDKNNPHLIHMLTLHQKNELPLFSYPCLKNNTEYYCIGTLHFFQKKIQDRATKRYGVDERYHYAFSISIWRYDTCVKIREMIEQINSDWNREVLDKELFEACIKYTDCKATKEKIKEWQSIYDNQISIPGGDRIKTENLSNQNLYKMPRYRVLIQHCTYEKFSQFIALKYTEPITEKSITL